MPSTVFPGSLDNILNPVGSTALNDATMDHAGLHTHVGTAVEALETKLGFGSTSQVPSASGQVLAGLPSGQSIWGYTAWVVLSTQTLGSAVATITFSGIPATFGGLAIHVIGATTEAAATSFVLCQFNGDTASNYGAQRVESNGSTTTSAETLATTSIALGRIAGNTGLGGAVSATVHGYATSWRKVTEGQSAALRDFSAGGITHVSSSGAWLGTNPINSITLIAGGGSTFKIATRAILYGVPVS
jgi:hypothetical protein